MNCYTSVSSVSHLNHFTQLGLLDGMVWYELIFSVNFQFYFGSFSQFSHSVKSLQSVQSVSSISSQTLQSRRPVQFNYLFLLNLTPFCPSQTPRSGMTTLKILQIHKKSLLECSMVGHLAFYSFRRSFSGKMCRKWIFLLNLTPFCPAQPPRSGMTILETYESLARTFLYIIFQQKRNFQS